MSAIRTEALHSYVTPNQTTVDNALQKGDFSRASRYAAEIIGRHREQPEETLSNELFHVMVKQIAMPLYERAYSYFYGTEDVFSGHRADEVVAVYGHVVDLLEKLRYIIEETEPLYRDGERYVGYASELTVMALFCRQTTGEAGDKYEILPAYKQSDRGDLPVNGVRNGFDFVLVDYETEHDKYLQIKTTANKYGKYTTDITVISANDIAGGVYADLLALQSALIAECAGAASDEQTARIDRATEELSRKIEC